MTVTNHLIFLLIPAFQFSPSYGTYNPRSDLIKKYKDVERVTYIGWINRDEMIKQYDAVDTFVFPSLADSFSFSCAEAMLSCLPVICTRNTGIPDIIDNYSNGILVDACSTESLVIAMKWCLENREKLSAIGRRGKDAVIKNCSEEQYDQSMKNVFRKLINNNI